MAKSRSSQNRRATRPNIMSFARHAAYIVAKCERAREKVNQSEYYRETQVLKRYVYRHIRELLARGDDSIPALTKFVVGRDGAKATPASDSPFVWGLRLVSGQGRLLISKQNRSKYAAELLYAHYHDTPAKLLTPFLASVGDNALIQRRLAAKAREKWAARLDTAGWAALDQRSDSP